MFVCIWCEIRAQFHSSCGHLVFLTSLLKRLSFHIINSWHLFQRLVNSYILVNLNIFLDSLFCFIDLYVCFYAVLYCFNTISLYLLQSESVCLQFYSSSSGLVWLFGIFWNSVWISGFFFLFLFIMPLVFLIESALNL